MVAALLGHWVATHLYLLTSWATITIISILIARWQWERVETMMKARIIREMERKAGVPISIEALRCRPLKGELGLTNLIVRGSEGTWQHEYFLKVQQLTCKAHGGLLGCASLAGMVSFDLGTHLPLLQDTFSYNVLDEIFAWKIRVNLKLFGPDKPDSSALGTHA